MSSQTDGKTSRHPLVTCESSRYSRNISEMTSPHPFLSEKWTTSAGCIRATRGVNLLTSYDTWSLSGSFPWINVNVNHCD